MKAFYLVGLLTVPSLIGSQALADERRDVLAVAQNTLQSLSHKTFEKTVEWYVQRNLETVQQDMQAGSASAGINIPLVEFLLKAEAEGNYQSESIKEWRDDFESTGSVDVDQSAFSLFTSTSADQYALAVWSECMNRQDWDATITGDVSGAFALSLEWDGHPAVQPVLSAAPGLANVAASDPITFAYGTIFTKEDTRTQLYNRGDPNLSAILTFNMENAPDVVIELAARPPYKAPVPEPPEWPVAFTPGQNATYQIRALHSAKCMHVSQGSSDNRIEMWQWNCEPQPHFQFAFDQAADGWYRIRSTHTGKCFHIQGASTELRAPLWQWDCTDQEHFQFEFRPSVDYEDYYQIVARHSGLCLHVMGAAVEDRTPYWQWGCQDRPHFMFRMEPTD